MEWCNLVHRETFKFSKRAYGVVRDRDYRGKQTGMNDGMITETRKECNKEMWADIVKKWTVNDDERANCRNRRDVEMVAKTTCIRQVAVHLWRILAGN